MMLSVTATHMNHAWDASTELKEWNKRIKHQVGSGNSKEAILSYKKLLQHGCHPDNYTFPILLKAASHLSSSHVGSLLHAHALKTGFSQHAFVQTALLNFYSSIGHVDQTLKVFLRINQKDSFAYNSMLDAYVSAGHMDNAVHLFDSMPTKDQVSFNIIISGYANLGRLDSARKVFDEMPLRDVVSWNSMILGYTKVGDVSSALELFHKMPRTSVVSWNTMLCGYLQVGLYGDVIDLFRRMITQQVEPTHVTMTTVLSACASMGALDVGIALHVFAMDTGLVLDPHVVTSLIDMYAKCGSIERALQAFYKFQYKDQYCYNVIISGLAFHGNGRPALDMFREMMTKGLSPDDITFIAVLSACSHSGLVEEGRHLFQSMESMFGIQPKSEHYGCMVDLLARAGFLHTALELIRNMPFEPGHTMWGALLSSCLIHRNFEIGEIVAKVLTSQLECLSDGEHVMLANLYELCNRWDEANRFRAMMDNKGINKTAGCSIIVVNGRIYKFLAGDVQVTEKCTTMEEMVMYSSSKL